MYVASAAACRKLQDILLLLLHHHLQGGTHTFLLGIGGTAHKTCSTNITKSVRTTRSLVQVAQTHIVGRERVGSGEHNLALNRYILLLHISRTLADIYLVERHERESRLAVHNESVLKGERVDLGYNAVGSQCLGVGYTAAYVDVDGRCLVGKATSLKHKVLDGLVVGILVYTRILHLASYADGTLIEVLGLGRHKQHVVLLQRYVGYSACQDTCKVYAYHLKRAVFLHTVQHGTIGKRHLLYSLGMLDKCAHAVDLFAKVVQARTEHGTLNLDGVGITRNDRIDHYRVAV